MPNPTPCCPKCGTPVLVNTPGSQGNQGATGATGPTGATGATGPVGLTWEGAWSSVTNYVANQAVYYNGSAWIALQASLNVTPTAGAYWSLLAQGQTGATGAEGTLVAYATYGSGTYTLTNSSVLLNLNSTPPTLLLPAAGTYLIFARLRFDGSGATTTTQVLSFNVFDSTNSVIVPNSGRSFAFVPGSTVTGTLAELTTPVVTYGVTGATTINLYGGLNALPSAGSIVCVEADIIAIKID